MFIATTNVTFGDALWAGVILLSLFFYAALWGFIGALVLQMAVRLVTKIKLSYWPAYGLVVAINTLYGWSALTRMNIRGAGVLVDSTWIFIFAVLACTLISAWILASRVKYPDGRSIGYSKAFLVSLILLLILVVFVSLILLTESSR